MYCSSPPSGWFTMNLNCPFLFFAAHRHDVLRCQAADVLKPILVEFFMLVDIDRIFAIVNCTTIATAVHFLSAFIISGASESVAKNRVVNRDAWVRVRTSLVGFCSLGKRI